MDTVTHLRRRTITIPFSREFESLLLNAETEHRSLTHDLETFVRRGLTQLEELEDVTEIKHTGAIQHLISITNQHCLPLSTRFRGWHISVVEDVLDEVDLLILAHGEDLKNLGLRAVNPGTILMLLALAALSDAPLRSEQEALALHSV